MKSINKFVFVIIIIYLIQFTVFGLINSKIIQWGIFVYLPGAFFLASSLYLDFKRGLSICIFFGFLLDAFYNCRFGFHAILLPLFFLIGKKWSEEYGNNNSLRQVFIQCVLNLTSGILLYFLLIIDSSNGIYWSLKRFILDIFVSTIIMIPFSFWQKEFFKSIFEKEIYLDSIQEQKF